ncbi:MAG: hypothetical protein GY903_30620 [Fuerstiella sp.]|nr:hypothetical protein [Fuerstiella sp.]
MKIDVVRKLSNLDIAASRPDLRRDLHVFATYVRDRDVKRGHRDNWLSKVDSRRLAKLCSDSEAGSEVEQHGTSSWIDYVDRVALRLGLVEYDTTGQYAGYTSREPCFPENYIQFNAKAYRQWTSMTLAQQEERLLELLLKQHQGPGCEFFRTSILGRLDRFDSFGSGTAVVPMLDFTAVRRSLLNLMAGCPTGEWLSVASLVEYLKENDRYFLIPQKPKFKEKWSQKKGRYGNFFESAKRWGREIEISEKDADAFERVEGRYVERFLEGIPLLLGYVDVAYAKRPPRGVRPSLGHLSAFRVNERLQRALTSEIAEPTLRVTPSFDVYVQSELYPARLMSVLETFCDLVSEDTVTVFRLDRKRVTTACAADPKLNVTALLESLCVDPLPANVRRELADWAADSDKFVLYTGCSLLETRDKTVDIDRFRVENIATGIDLVKSPDKVYQCLETQQLVPLRIVHEENSLTPLPPRTTSAFRKRSAAKKKRRAARTKITLMRVTNVQLLCPDRSFLEQLQRLLANANCPVEADHKRLSLAYSNRYEKDVNKAIRTLKTDFEVRIDDQQ